MSGRLNGRVALITGGGSGIGRAACLTLAREGACVVVADINLSAAQDTARQIGDLAFAARLDVASELAWEAAVQATVRRFARLDIVANIAGIGVDGSIEDITVEQMQRVFDVNVLGVALGCKHGLRGILSSGGSGAIVNMSSIMGIAAASDLAAYSASKGAVTTLTRSVALHCAEKGYPVRCISIHPTYVLSEMLDPMLLAAGAGREDVLASMARNIPIGRLATPQDVANSVLFAVSDDAAMISGSSIVIDGGQLAGPRPSH